MKKIMVFILVSMLLMGCYQVGTSYNYIPGGGRIVVLDNCEYISTGYKLAHKGNCKYCEERRKKEQEELIQKIYEQQTKK